MNIGLGQQTMLEDIYLGSLLHDYGKVLIQNKFFDNPGSKECEHAIRKHPELGKTSLLLGSDFNDEVIKIITEHHERHDGKCYPKGLRGNKIYQLTKLVSIASIFDNFETEDNGPIPERHSRAIKKLASDKGNFFDPKILEKCIKALQFVI
jgi:response regulator RpfG family c-di-GMP phosphodiesterase